MRFMMMIKAGDEGVPPSPELMAAVGKYTEEMIKAGVVVGTGGLFPSAKGARIRAAGGKLSVVDGPFTESKELIGGYAIIEAKSKAEAIELGSCFMKLHVNILGAAYEGECEVREMFDPADCGKR